MVNKKLNKFENFMGKMLQALMVAGHHEDYITEENGKVVYTPANVWHANALKGISR